MSHSLHPTDRLMRLCRAVHVLCPWTARPIPASIVRGTVCCCCGPVSLHTTIIIRERDDRPADAYRAQRILERRGYRRVLIGEYTMPETDAIKEDAARR